MSRLLQLEGPDLDALLHRVRNELGADARIVRAEKVRTGGIGGFFAKERYEMTVDLGGDAGSDEGQGVDEAPDGDAPATSALELAERMNETERVSTESPSFAGMLAALTDVTSPSRTAAAKSGPPSDAPADSRPRNAAADSCQPDTMEPAPAAPPEPAEHDGVRDEPAEQTAALRALGLPPHLLPPAGSHALPDLLSGLRRLPAAPEPPREPGSLLVVVGPAAIALPAARTVAAELGLDPAAVALVSAGLAAATVVGDLRIGDEQTAAARRRAWQRLGHPNVVALDAPLILRPPGWAREMLAALDPTAAWAAVSLTTKTADLRRWLDELGGRVDALVAEDSAGTVAPADVLALGLPVARLDGRPATPAAWAVTLVERLSS